MGSSTYTRRCLIAPLRRDQVRDFASGTGNELAKSKVIQVLLTEGSTARTSGELPWRTAFGAGLHLLRHERNDDVLRELALVRVRDALARWAPGVEVTALSVERKDATLTIRLRYRAATDENEQTAEVTL
jgi:phage baseplate assembly protein W